MSLLDLLRAPSVSPGKLRQEIYMLGGRHKGDALGGALIELKADDLTAERRALLRAVVSHLGKGGGAGMTHAETSEARRAGPGDLVYLGVIIGAATWVTVVIRSLAG